MTRVLLLVPSTTYRATAFIEAARRLGFELVVGSDRRQVFEDAVPGHMPTLDFNDQDAAVAEIERFAGERPLQGLVGADDETTLLAAAAARALGLRGNPPQAVAATRNKLLLRQRLERHRIPGPWYRCFDVAGDPASAARAVRFPCVLKPTFLAASRGVIRADGPGEFAAAYARIRKILQDPKLEHWAGAQARQLLVEEYLPGSEYAVEAILSSGSFRLLALFDKPDPLEGPYFEETLYVTPSRAPEDLQEQIVAAAERAVHALGLAEGPVHAELRATPRGVFLIEVAARAIGGRCSRVLRFEDGASLEELILRQAVGEDVSGFRRESRAAGVMMIPIPRAGVLREVAGVEEARAVEGVEAVEITLARTQPVEPLPEGFQYLGFLLARATTPDEVEAALRRAHGLLRVEIDPA